MTRTHCVETSLLRKIIIKISVRKTPVVICSRRAAKTANFFISKMNNNGATPIIEKTETVPVGVVEELFNNSVNAKNE